MRTFAPLTLFLLAACGPSEPDGAAPDQTAGPSTEARVAATATQPGELPPAILGNGGELEGTDLRYVEDDSLTVGYLAVPDGEGPFPSLVIVHEWDGLKDRVRQVADDLAAEGYVTLAADLFRGRTGSSRQENVALMDSAQSRIVPNLNAAVANLRSRDDVTGRVGAMGWCYGGGVVLSFGLDGAEHEATAIFYGQLVDDPERLASLDHEVYGTFGQLDPGPSPEAVERFEQALRAAGIENDLHIYDEVGHGFWLRVDEDPDTRRAPALDAWQRLKSYLSRTLGAQ